MSDKFVCPPLDPIDALLAPLSEKDLPALDIEDTVAIRATHFPYHEKDVLRLNHGSFGAPPKCVVDEAVRQYMRFIAQPDKMYFDSLIGGDGVAFACKSVAKLLNHPDDKAFTLVENATTAAVIVAHAVAARFITGEFAKGDMVVMFDTTYNAVVNVVTEIIGKVGAAVLRFPNPFPVRSEDELLAALQAALEQASASAPDRKIRLVVLDHITSVPTILMPIKQMVAMCHKHGVAEVFVDGAHAIGNCPSLDLQDIDCEYYCSNIHKWMFAPPGAAFFFAKPSTHSLLHHPIVSHNYCTGVSKESSWVGTRDYSSYLAVPHAIQFYLSWNKSQASGSDPSTAARTPFGGMAVFQRNHSLVVRAARMLSEAFQTPPCTPDALMTSMAMVQLPQSLGLQNNDQAHALRGMLRKNHSIETVVWVKQIDGKPVAFLRISAQLYNRWPDYEALRDALLLFC